MSLAGWWTARKRRPPSDLRRRQRRPRRCPGAVGRAATAPLPLSLSRRRLARRGAAAIPAAAIAPSPSCHWPSVTCASSAGWSALPPGAGPSPCPVIGQMLEQVDAITASETLRAGLLPRAPHVVPQLMKTLRDETLLVGRRRQPDLEGRRPHRRGRSQRDQRVRAHRGRRRDRPRPRRLHDRHAGPAPGDRQRRPAADLRCPWRHALGAGRDPDLERRRPQGAPVRRPRRADCRRSIRSTATSPGCSTTRAGPRRCARSTAWPRSRSAPPTWPMATSCRSCWRVATRSSARSSGPGT